LFHWATMSLVDFIFFSASSFFFPAISLCFSIQFFSLSFLSSFSTEVNLFSKWQI
jgi:hypothetical protein